MFCGISSNTGTLTCRHDMYHTTRSLLKQDSVRGRLVQNSPPVDGLRPDGCSTKNLRSEETSSSAVSISLSSLNPPEGSSIVVQDAETTPTSQNSQETIPKATLGSLQTHRLVPNDLEISKSELLAPPRSLSDAEKQPSVEACSPVLKPLAQQWQFPLHEALYKITPGALDGLMQEQFEDLVMKGFIIEDDKGFQWTANHRYLLHRDREEVLHGTSSESLSAGNHVKNDPRHKQSLISRPSLTHYTDSMQHGDIDPRSSDFRPIYQRRGIRKLPNPVPAVEPMPLPSPWHFPPDALYIEAFPDATRNLSNSKIETMVTRGLFIAYPAGIRDVGTDLYRLVYVGERDKGSKQHVPRITKCRAAGNPASTGKPPIPIVEEVESGMCMMMKDKTGKSKKTVRFSHKLRCLDPWGGGRSEEIRDNEGLSSSLAKHIMHGEVSSAVDARSYRS